MSMSKNEKAMAGYVSACIPVSMRDELREIADQESLNVSALIRDLLSKWMAEQKSLKEMRADMVTTTAEWDPKPVELRGAEDTK